MQDRPPRLANRRAGCVTLGHLARMCHLSRCAICRERGAEKGGAADIQSPRQRRGQILPQEALDCLEQRPRRCWCNCRWGLRQGADSHVAFHPLLSESSWCRKELQRSAPSRACYHHLDPARSALACHQCLNVLDLCQLLIFQRGRFSPGQQSARLACARTAAAHWGKHRKGTSVCRAPQSPARMPACKTWSFCRWLTQQRRRPFRSLCFLLRPLKGEITLLLFLLLHLLQLLQACCCCCCSCGIFTFVCVLLDPSVKSFGL